MTIGTHADAAFTKNQAGVTEPTFAERARTLVYVRHIGSLSTVSRRQPGFPYGSVAPYGLDERGNPIFLISTMAMHTQNLLANPRASLLVTQSAVDEELLAASRVTLIGNVRRVSESDLTDIRARYLSWHRNSTDWIDYDDFSFYRMDIVDVYFVGGFGVMGWVPPAEYCGARPDPLADSANEIIRHMNRDHADALRLLTKQVTGAESQLVEMASVDRLGFQVRIRTSDGFQTARIPFSREANGAAETRKILIEMVAAARGQ
ncbi:MAG TPA: DUF2470 domain-containing protein [Candidatus Acidoferrales bacterium]|jgi:hypothetical protein|nr:DUF2470 domain-containing protein [Candidatus Acidoferrales bacterium]